MRDLVILFVGCAVTLVILLTPLRAYLFEGIGWCWDHSVARFLSWLIGIRSP